MNDIGSSTNREVTLALKGISKVFPGVVALDKVDFSLHTREIVGLVGENGAGKSTLMKIMIGISQPDEGTITPGRHTDLAEGPHRRDPAWHRHGLPGGHSGAQPVDHEKPVPLSRARIPEAGFSLAAGDARCCLKGHEGSKGQSRT